MVELGRPVVSDLRLEMSSGWARPRGHGPHFAADVPMPVGTVLAAVFDGTIVHVDRADNSDAGRWLALRHRDGTVFRYLHMERVDVEEGQRVRQGAALGLSGNTGHSSGPHLHGDLSVAEARVAAVLRALGGTPRTPPTGTTGWGVKVPLEPFLPVDVYRQVVVDEAAAEGIPLRPAFLRAQRRRAAVGLGIATALAVGIAVVADHLEGA